MTPHEYLRRFQSDRTLLTGASLNQGEVAVEAGDVVGVVLLGLGGPSTPEEVTPFLYSRLMDPAEVDLRVPRAVRHRVAAFMARRKGAALSKAFELIGGSSPLRRHAVEQAVALERVLNARYGALTQARFRTYVAMRHGEPSMEAAQRQMRADGVNKAVLLPLQPHFAASTTGSSLSHWTAALRGEPLPTALVSEYATHPKLVCALRERIDEALQRFPHEARASAQVLFVAQGVPRRHLAQFGDPYCCHVEATARAVLEDAGEPGRALRIAYQRPLGAGRGRGLSVADAIEDLAEEGATALLVVPISYISDRIETAFGLDVTGRAMADEAGITHYEVSSGLNCHPLLIEALAEAVGTHVRPLRHGQGDGQTADAALSPPAPRSGAPSGRTCSVCGRATPTREWPPEPAPTPVPTRRSAA